MVQTKDFLSPNSMLTPGIAGGVVVTISLPLAHLLDLKILWICLAMSFLCGLLLVSSFKDPMPRLQRGLYLVFNSLIIFSTSVGVNSNIDREPTAPAPPELQLGLPAGAQVPTDVPPSISMFLGITTAHASQHDGPRSSTSSTPPPSRSSSQQPQQRVELTKEQIEQVNRYNREREEYIQKQKAREKRWSW